MKSNYKKIGEHIQLVDERNDGLKVKQLLGLSISKQFIPSVANIIGTDMENYKIIRKNQFACSTMQVRRDKKMPVALLQEVDEAIISQAYPIFEVKDGTELLPEYLMMWFTRSEFDREACFNAVGGVRGSLEWEDFCEMQLPIPHPDKQKEIVKEYNVIQNRIALNQQLIQKLEETAQAIYKQWFVDEENGDCIEKTLNDLCSLITDGKHGDCEDEFNSGYYFLSAKDLRENTLIFEGARQITKKDFDETHRRTNLKPGDICMVNTGATIGRMSIAPNKDLTLKSTFQKSVAIIKPRINLTTSCYLYCLLNNHIKEITELGSGTSQPNLLIGDLKKYPIQYPGYEKILQFENKISPVFKMQYLKTTQNRHLNKFRELLLSKLTTIEN